MDNCYIHSLGTQVCDPCKKRYFPEPEKATGNPKIKINGLELGDYRYVVSAAKVSKWNYQDDVEDGYDIEKEKKAIKKAKDNGMKIIEGTPDTLLLDLDKPEYFDRFKEMLEMVDNKIGISMYEIWMSKSGGSHRHARVFLKNELDIPARIGLQSIMGSDPRRETFGMYKYARGVGEPSLLFQPNKAVIQKVDYALPF